MSRFLKLIVALVIMALTSGFRATMTMEMPSIKKAMTAAVAGLFAAGAMNAPANAFTKEQIVSLSYDQVKGSGLANRCPDIPGTGSQTIAINSKYKLNQMCIEPTSFQLEDVVNKKGVEVKEFVNTKLLTRQSYTLYDVGGNLESVGGKATFFENDGIDYAPITLQTPGGERVPLLFTVKELVATGTGDKIKPGFEMGGSFNVPSYRTGLFMDPTGRGGTVGWDHAKALPAVQNGVEGEAFIFNENNKRFDVLKGDIEFAVNTVDEVNGDMRGVFVSTQPGDTDMGAKVPKTILIKGIWTGHVDKN